MKYEFPGSFFTIFGGFFLFEIIVYVVIQKSRETKRGKGKKLYERMNSTDYIITGQFENWSLAKHHPIEMLEVKQIN